MAEQRSLRKIALGLLCEYEELGKYVNLSLSSHMLDGLSDAERAALTALLYTTVEHKLTYDYYISALSGRGGDKIDFTTKNILRLGLAQLLDMDGIPAFAAVNETVKLARNKGERAFVNAVLRAAERASGSLPLPDRKKNAARYLSVRYSFSMPIVRALTQELGEEGAEAVLSHYSSLPPTDLTVNLNKISREELIARLEAAGYTATPSELSDISVRISGSVNPQRLPGYSEGLFFVQDAACAAAVSALSAESGNLVVDCCACPGGKSFAAAVTMRGVGEIYSYDVSESKLPLISSGAARLGFSIIKPTVRNALNPDCDMLGRADRVICDVPCSGLGVLAKKPDMRYKDVSNASELFELQYGILSASAGYLRCGGRLMYSTCTLRLAENEGVLLKFLEENKNFRPVDFSVGDEMSHNGSFTFLPHRHKTDGFFVGIIERVL